MSFSVHIVADSISPEGHRLTTMSLKYPRYIHSELMTHRAFSRNAQSSRAYPTDKYIKEVVDRPVMPLVWGSNKKGMVAGPEIDNIIEAEKVWLEASTAAVEHAGRLHALGVHKQVVNRLLEPFAVIHTVVTATDWDNFYKLRRASDAQPEIKHLADLMWDAYQNSYVRLIEYGQWHLPFLTDEEQKQQDIVSIKASAARCARVSYVNHLGTYDISRDLRTHDMLLKSLHMSPFEHQATPEVSGRYANFTGWKSYRYKLENSEMLGLYE